MKGVSLNKDGSFTVAPNTPIHDFIRDITENYILGPTSRSFSPVIAMQDWAESMEYKPVVLALEEIRVGNKTNFRLLSYQYSRVHGGIRDTMSPQMEIGDIYDLKWLGISILKRLAGNDAIPVIWDQY